MTKYFYERSNITDKTNPINNFKFFSYPRGYSPKKLLEGDPKLSASVPFSTISTTTINATDGFAVINGFLEKGFKNLNIIGFTAFGRDEDLSYHTSYGAHDSRYAGKKYFDLKTSENQRVEADILQSYIQNKKINNLEDYGKLMSYLKYSWPVIEESNKE